MVLVKVKRATPPRRPLAIDLFCGLGGWSHGLLAEGYDVIGYDIERHAYGDHAYPGKLVLQDVLTIHGSQFKDADLIVASPPCQEYSYMAMPWSRAKQIARGLRGQDEFPEGYRGSRTLKELTALFDACFRIQREASEAAGKHIPMVVENVRGAQPWVGRARSHYGSFYLWGDVPALLPIPHKARKVWFAVANNTTSGHSKNPVHEAAKAHREISPGWRAKHYDKTEKMALTNQAEHDAVKQPGIGGIRENGKGDAWFQDGAVRHGSKSSARKAASARIAMIPERLARHIARWFKLSDVERLEAIERGHI